MARATTWVSRLRDVRHHATQNAAPAPDGIMRRGNERRQRTEARSVILARTSELSAESETVHLRTLITEACQSKNALRVTILIQHRGTRFAGRRNGRCAAGKAFRTACLPVLYAGGPASHMPPTIRRLPSVVITGCTLRQPFRCQRKDPRPNRPAASQPARKAARARLERLRNGSLRSDRS
jgi:hypothetical protein